MLVRVLVLVLAPVGRHSSMVHCVCGWIVTMGNVRITSTTAMFLHRGLPQNSVVSIVLVMLLQRKHGMPHLAMR
jgi:hypothetical protein